MICKHNKVAYLSLMQDGYRCDGRGFEDYRPMELETGLLANAHGSARIRLVIRNVYNRNDAFSCAVSRWLVFIFTNTLIELNYET